MAFSDYPKEHESIIHLKNGASALLRPIVPSDASLILDLFSKLSDEARYLRFLRHMDELPESLLQRLVNVDYSSGFALAAVTGGDGKQALVAVARYSGEKGGPADLALVVRDDWQGLGLGTAMLRGIVDIGREHGLVRFNSMMDSRNAAMKHILASLGYQVRYSNRNGIYMVEIIS